MSKRIKMLLTTIALMVTVFAACTFTSSAASGKWICAWSTAPTQIGVDGYENITAFVGDVTARVVFTPTANGTKLRVRVSNVYGEKPLELTRVTVAKSVEGSKIDTATTKIVTFNEGYQNITVPAGKEYYSDPVVFDVKAQESIAISFYAHEFTEISTMGLSGADTYLSLGGDSTSAASFGFGEEVEKEQALSIMTKLLGINLDPSLAYSFVKVVPCISGVDVYSDEDAYSVVVAGDSTVANEFPLYLSQAINNNKVSNVGVAGKGILGNRLTGDGLGLIGSQIYGESLISRFERDVLSQAGVEYVIVKIGANDIMHPVCKDIKEQYPNIKQPTAQDIIAGYKKIFTKCHDAGIKVIAISITQWKGNTRNYFGTGDKYVRTKAQFNADWKIAQTVNKWLSETSLHDGFVNFNDISADPKDPAAFLPEYTIDGAHPSDSLQKIWGDYFPLSLIGVGNKPSGVKLSTTDLKLNVGKGKKITATVLPKKAKDKTVKWSSSNKKVATVSSSGYVKAISNGKATITCKTNTGGITAKCTVTVTTKPTAVKLNKTKATIYTTKSVALKATVSPSNATEKGVKWSSSNTKVATVSSKGVVTGVGSGKATITCTTVSGSLKAKCVITVARKTEVASISLNRTKVGVFKGATYQLKATVSPSNATFKDVKWSSSNKKAVTVSSKGLVKAVGKGSATITCTSVDNPMVKKTCYVKVKYKTTGIKLDKTSVKIYEGQKTKLVANVLPSAATNKNVTWKSQNKSIVAVSQSGTIRGVKPGTTYVICTTESGGFVAKCKVTVTKVVKSTSVKINLKTLVINQGTYARLGATVSPSNTSNRAVTWSSSNSKIVKVYSDGKLYGVKNGKATITCKTKDTGKTAKCVVTVNPVTPTSVKLNKTSLTLNNSKTFQIKATVYPSNASNKAVRWSSSDPSVVYVNANGVVKGMKPGKSAVITCTTVSGKKIAKCTVKVNPIKVTKISLNKTSVNTVPGKTFTLTAKVYPSNATNKSVKWTTNNPKVATVSSKGVVKALKEGKAIIGCVSNDGGFVAVCTVEVKVTKVMGVKLDIANATANVGQSFTLKATVVPENATNKKVVWSTTDSKVAKVSSSGKVTAVGLGRCAIKATTVDGNCIAICNLYVR